MTMTETRETTTTVLEVTWQTLSDLASVSASAATDKRPPILTAIQLVSDSTRLTATATDSYTLARVSVESAAPMLEVLIPAAWLLDALKATKVTRAPQLALTLSVTGQTITLSDGRGVTMTTLAQDGTYPSVAPIIPTEDNYTSELGAFNPQFLARMAKILPPRDKRDTTRAWRCVSMSATKPALWKATTYEAEAEFLQMPVRIS